MNNSLFNSAEELPLATIHHSTTATLNTTTVGTTALRSSKNFWKKGVFAIGALSVAGLLSLNSCATSNTTDPTPAATDTNSVSVDEFFTPAPTGSADDYYFMFDNEDDVEYSYFIDEEDFIEARDHEKGKGDKHYDYSWQYVKNGHGYGDHNHLHIHRPGPHHYHGVYIGLRRRKIDWTDSLQLTSAEKLSVDSAMKAFHECTGGLLDSFRVQLKPYRDNFRTQRLAIIAKLDSNVITRDSARAMLDSAIAKYELETQMIRAGIVEDIKTCLQEMDIYLRTKLTPAQYAIWVRNRGW